MGRKYIIEIIGGEEGDMDFSTIEPYTEPDMEQVRKEAYDNGYETAKHECEDCQKIRADAEQELADKAYQRGYENGFIAGHLKAEKSGQSFYEDGYQCGLNDAWEAARKICLAESEGGFSGKTVCYIFNTEYYRDALKDYTPAKAIEKIRQYEQEKEEQDGLRQNIQTIVDQCGYTLDEIASVLQKMRES